MGPAFACSPQRASGSCNQVAATPAASWLAGVRCVGCSRGGFTRSRGQRRRRRCSRRDATNHGRISLVRSSNRLARRGMTPAAAYSRWRERFPEHRRHPRGRACARSRTDHLRARTTPHARASEGAPRAHRRQPRRGIVMTVDPNRLTPAEYAKSMTLAVPVIAERIRVRKQRARLDVAEGEEILAAPRECICYPGLGALRGTCTCMRTGWRDTEDGPRAVIEPCSRGTSGCGRGDRA